MVTARLDGRAGNPARGGKHHGRVAVAVLPYDPARKTAMLVRQFRAPVKLASGADDLLEPPAGMIDGDGFDGGQRPARSAWKRSG